MHLINNSLESAYHSQAKLEVPEHVALIMDGNGRWANRRNLPRTAGHLRGIRSVRRTVKKACELGIQYLTLFAFSSENWQREASEVTFLMKLLERYLAKESVNLRKEGVRLHVIGDRSRLTFPLQQAIRSVERDTANGMRLKLTLAISYGGQDEIVSAARSLANACVSGVLQQSAINRSVFAKHLLMPDLPPVDLLIRTGGEQRISNFLLWQLAYAELIFLPTLWPEFSETHLSECIEQFKERNRRFGQVL